MEKNIKISNLATHQVNKTEKNGNFLIFLYTKFYCADGPLKSAISFGCFSIVLRTALQTPFLDSKSELFKFTNAINASRFSNYYSLFQKFAAFKPHSMALLKEKLSVAPFRTENCEECKKPHHFILTVL